MGPKLNALIRLNGDHDAITFFEELTEFTNEVHHEEQLTAHFLACQSCRKTGGLFLTQRVDVL